MFGACILFSPTALQYPWWLSLTTSSFNTWILSILLISGTEKAKIKKVFKCADLFMIYFALYLGRAQCISFLFFSWLMHWCCKTNRLHERTCAKYPMPQAFYRETIWKNYCKRKWWLSNSLSFTQSHPHFFLCSLHIYQHTVCTNNILFTITIYTKSRLVCQSNKSSLNF